MSISAQNQGETGTVICKIQRGSGVVAEPRSEGAYVIASCSDSPPIVCHRDGMPDDLWTMPGRKHLAALTSVGDIIRLHRKNADELTEWLAKQDDLETMARIWDDRDHTQLEDYLAETNRRLFSTSQPAQPRESITTLRLAHSTSGSTGVRCPPSRCLCTSSQTLVAQPAARP